MFGIGNNKPEKLFKGRIDDLQRFLMSEIYPENNKKGPPHISTDSDGNLELKVAVLDFEKDWLLDSRAEAKVYILADAINQAAKKKIAEHKGPFIKISPENIGNFLNLMGTALENGKNIYEYKESVNPSVELNSQVERIAQAKARSAWKDDTGNLHIRFIKKNGDFPNIKDNDHLYKTLENYFSKLKNKSLAVDIGVLDNEVIIPAEKASVFEKYIPGKTDKSSWVDAINSKKSISGEELLKALQELDIVLEIKNVKIEDGPKPAINFEIVHSRANPEISISLLKDAIAKSAGLKTNKENDLLEVVSFTADTTSLRLEYPASDIIIKRIQENRQQPSLI